MAMQDYIFRKITERLDTLFLEKQILVITGMRRVGKTTQLKYLFDGVKTQNKIFLSLEDSFIRKIFTEINYENIKASLENYGINFAKKAYIFIDEIQLVPEISSVIKYFYDEYEVKFAVSGSSSYYIKNHFTESLSGRKFVVELFPLTFNEFLRFKGFEKKELASFEDKVANASELGQDTYLELYKEYMTYGGFPDVVLAKDNDIKREILKDIINSYFQIDVVSLANFSDIGTLRDLLTLLTQRIGQKINISSLATVLKVSRPTVYEYLEFLKATYVINTISQKSSFDNKVAADHKLYFTDTGLASTLADISSGGKFENSVHMNLIYDYDLSYFQTKSGGEIDFILDDKIGIEVKEASNNADLSTLKRRADALKIDEYYLLSLHFTGTAKTIMAWDL